MSPVAATARPWRTTETVMGTVVSFDVVVPPGAEAACHRAVAQARLVLHRADAVFSRWKPDSPMSRIARGDLAVADAPPEVTEVLERCRLARRRTHGWFDHEAGGDLDPTGLVKGWAAARALEVLVAAGLPAAMVNAGGDVATAGRGPSGPWRLGVADPHDRGRLVAVAEVDGALATSGPAERGLHLVDPWTGRPHAAVASASVTGPELDLADAAATALAVAGPDGFAFLADWPGYEGLVVGHDGAVAATPGFPLAR